MPLDYPTRQRLEDFWREQVHAARQKYHQAAVKANKALNEHKDCPLPVPDGSFSIIRARLEESAARSEYMRVLGIFNDLIVHGKMPENPK